MNATVRANPSINFGKTRRKPALRVPERDAATSGSAAPWADWRKGPDGVLEGTASVAADGVPIAGQFATVDPVRFDLRLVHAADQIGNAALD